MGYSIENDYSESTSRISPFFNPGSYNVRILGISLEHPAWDKSKTGAERHIKILVEGPEITEEGFEGCLIDRNHPELGNYVGQIATIQAGQWSFKDFTTRAGKFIPRDNQIGNWVCNFARLIGKFEEIKTIKDNDIEEWIDDASDILANTLIAVTFGGQEYKNSKGYSAFSMYFPKPEGMLYPYANASYSPEVMAKSFLKFHEKYNLPIYVKKEEAVTSFAGKSEPVPDMTTKTTVAPPLNFGQVNF
jgi:hypothetical protein